MYILSKTYSGRGIPLLLMLTIVLYSCINNDTSSQPDATLSRSSMVTTDHLFAVESLDDCTWIAGFEGIIMHTTDRGKNWEIQIPPVSEDLYSICFINTTTGWITGKNGTILHTNNGGDNWTLQKSDTDQRLFDSYFVDEKTGWIVGTMGTILHTNNGGITWIKQGWDEDRYYNGVFFTDSQNGWIAGEYSIIYHTSNGGKTWLAQQCEELQPNDLEGDFPPPPPNLYGVYFISSDIGWISGMDGIIIKTKDGGTTWKRLTEKSDFTIYQVTVIKDKGWAIGAKGSYLSSIDGGNSWILKDDMLGTKFWLRDMSFTEDLHGWIVGAAGLIITTDNGGNTWKRISGIYFRGHEDLR